ncbi:MAG: hypothetical protein U0992_15205 [Planctomycetaceae bacterium]
MSTMNTDKVKVVLPRSGPDHFWTEIYRSYAGEDQRTWKYLAMFALRVNGGWAVDHIGRAFGHPKGHVTRCLRRIERELRENFAPPDDLWQGHELDDHTGTKLARDTRRAAARCEDATADGVWDASDED